MRKIIRNKRGELATFLPYLLIGLVVAFIFSIVTLVVSYAGDEIFDEMKDNPSLGASNSTIERINQVQGLMTGAFDQLVFFLLFGVFLALIVLAIYSDFHPVVLGFVIVFIILMVILGGMFANAHDEIVNNSVLSEKAAEFTLTNFIFGEKLPIFLAVAGVISVIIILAKRGGVTSPV